MSKTLNIIIFLFLLFLYSCSGEGDYCQYKSISGIWHHEDTLLFEVDSVSLSTQKLASHPVIIVRATEAYRYQYLRLLVNIGELRSDTISVQLFNEADEQQGTGLVHKSIEYPLDSIKGFSQFKSLQVRISQVMQTDTVQGITQIGFKF